MSTQVLTPDVPRPRRGLASIKSMFGSKRHTISQIPGSEQTSTLASSDSNDLPAAPAPSTDKNSSHSSGLFSSNPKRSMEKAAEKEKKEQAKQAIQLSTVDDQGAFVTPPPLEKGYKDHFRDSDEDFFDTILNTPPERVQTFLSAHKTISPGMFSSPASKIKRHTLSSFPTQWTPPAVSNDSMPPMVPPKDEYYPTTPGKSQAHMSFMTSSEDLAEALSESIGSLLSSPVSSSGLSSTQEVPELMMDDDDEEHSDISSAQSSPRHSTASLQQQQEQSARAMKARQLLDLGGELELPVEL
ncbi:hypothetical protein BG003_003269 [Podila horticola]|nr:hypothetical protein BG003_003269 [Podila horticola]